MRSGRHVGLDNVNSQNALNESRENRKLLTVTHGKSTLNEKLLFFSTS